jgi:FlaG/FlaF family flagellin (archaellin)
MKLLISILLVIFGLFKLNAQNVTYSIQAHQDDWQLFMSDSLSKDVAKGNKIVFITVTAGDAGEGAGFSQNSYFQVREYGSMRSAKFLMDLYAPAPTRAPDSTRVVINGHSIIKYTYLNAVNYYLRLADGDLSGAGYPNTGNRSLKRFFENLVPNMSSVDGTATYISWTDLVGTVQQIMVNERGGTTNTAIMNVASLDTIRGTGINRGDHQDHLFSSVLGQQAAATLPWCGIVEYVDYNSAILLSPGRMAFSSGIYGAYAWGLHEKRFPAPYDQTHRAWLPPQEQYVIVRRPQ